LLAAIFSDNKVHTINIIIPNQIEKLLGPQNTTATTEWVFWKMKVVFAVLMCKLLVSWINGDETVLSAEAVVTGVINLSKAFPNRYSFVNSQQTKIALSNISATLSSHVTSLVGIFIYLSFTDHRMLQSLYIYYITAATALAPLEARTILSI
jgi:hypothetical protein